MFTIEFLPDHTLVTVLDESDEFEDVQVVVAEEAVYLLQHDDVMQDTQSVFLSYQQLRDICASLNLTEGAYYLED